MLPVASGTLVLVLYILAMFGSMNWIGVIGALALLMICCSFVLIGSKGKKQFLSELQHYYINPVSLAIIAGLVGIGVLTSGHIATWWDDLNYWATDAKALYYLGHFTGKYGNVAPEFGDYPPALQIIKWCVARLNATEYSEGLSFAGYYVGNAIFMLPLVATFRKRKPVVMVCAFVIALLIPGIVNDVWRYGACADLFMGICYGSALVSVLDRQGHSKGFYYYRIFVLMTLTALTKNVGFEWAVYLCIFFIAVVIMDRSRIQEEHGKGYIKYTVYTILTAVSFQLSWWIYCLANRRIAKLTSSGAHMVASGYDLPDETAHKAELFLKGFAFEPMHTDHTWCLDLSQLTLIVSVLLVVISLGLFKKISKKSMWTYLGFMIVTALISYGMIFVAHVSIFAGETQYDSAEVMAISISRYTAPYTVGAIMLLIYMLTSCISGWIPMIACAVFVLVTTDYQAAYDCLAGYRATVEDDLQGRHQMIDEAGWRYVDYMKDMEQVWGHRVLFLRDDTEIHWVKDTYISNEVAPVATVYAGIDPTWMTTEDIVASVRSSHAEYLYVQDVGVDAGELLQPLMAESAEYVSERIYRIIDIDGALFITPVEQ